MKNLLVLSYYYPPLGLSGVQRTLKFIKYLPEYGWNPIVITPSHRGSYAYDPSLVGEVSRTKTYRTLSFDPLFLSPAGHRTSTVNRRGLTVELNRWFIPDNKLGWVPFAVNAALRASRLHRIDAVYSTAPPYSSHLAAVLTKKIAQKPLVADFRDAWTDYTWANHPTGLHRRLDLALEGVVLKNSDRIIAVNQEILNGLRQAHPKTDPQKFDLISHGYDPQDFNSPEKSGGNFFRITYSGTFIKNRSPKLLLEALKILENKKPGSLARMEISFAGSYRPEDANLVSRWGFGDRVKFLGYLPHRESVGLLMRSDLLWLVMGPEETANVTPGKLFEYLGTRKPILASVPPGETAGIIARTNAGTVVPSGDSQALAAALQKYISDWLAARPIYHGNQKILKTYDRRYIAGQLARLLDGLA
jgi:glycosyltransferase involved in cell wall biosynthesis